MALFSQRAIIAVLCLIQPDLTSYDYNAPISEAGWVTPKFDSIRTVMISKYIDYPIPTAPAAITVIEIPTIKLDKLATLNIKEMPKKESDKPLTFEQLNQGYGYVLFRKRFNQPINGRYLPRYGRLGQGHRLYKQQKYRTLLICRATTNIVYPGCMA